MMATSLDTYAQVCARYPQARQTLQKLHQDPQVTLVHGVDATQPLPLPPLPSLSMQHPPPTKKKQKQHQQPQSHTINTWDAIIWNFPYPTGVGTAGTHSATVCDHLLSEFFQRAQVCLGVSGQVYVTTLLRQQCSLPAGRSGDNDKSNSNWDLARMASHAGLELVACQPFSSDEYPGYRPKRSFDNTTFPYSQHARTFVFGHSTSSHNNKKKKKKKHPNSVDVMTKLRNEQREQQAIFHTNLQRLLLQQQKKKSNHTKIPDKEGIYVGVLRDVYEKKFPLDPFPDGMERLGVTLKRAAAAGVCRLEQRGITNRSSLWVTTATAAVAAITTVGGGIVQDNDDDDDDDDAVGTTGNNTNVTLLEKNDLR